MYSLEHNTAAPLELNICEKCELVQLGHTVDPKLLYGGAYYYRSGVNATMRSALLDVACNAQLYVKLEEADKVVDIGANDGTLLKNYPSDVQKIAFEPADIATPSYISRVKDYFSYTIWSSIWPDKAKIITACAMFYDIDDPNAFLEDVRQVLADDGIFIIQMNYLISMLRNNAFDNISHEHLCYYSIRDMKCLCEAHDLYIEDAELNDVNGGSVRLYIRKVTDKPIGQSDRLTQLRFKEDDFYDGLLKNHIRNMRLDVEKTGRKLRYALEGGRVCALGASTRGYVILQHFHLEEYITDLIDRNPDKVGKTIGNYTIKGEESIDQYDKALILPYFFKDEIMARDTAFKGTYIIPLPEVQLQLAQQSAPIMTSES